MGFKLRIPDSALTRPEIVREFFRDVINPFVERSVEYLAYEVQQVTPTGVTGELASSIVGTVTGMDRENEFRGSVSSPLRYALPVEEGSQPHWTAVANLIPWAEMHGIHPYALQWKIAREGTPAAGMFERGRAAALPQISLDWQRTIGATAYKLRRK